MVRHLDPDRLALLALGERLAGEHEQELTSHLAGCATCQEEVLTLRHTAQLAREAGAHRDEEERLRPGESVWNGIMSELGLAGRAGPADPAGPPAPRADPTPGPGRRPDPHPGAGPAGPAVPPGADGRWSGPADPAGPPVPPGAHGRWSGPADPAGSGSWEWFRAGRWPGAHGPDTGTGDGPWSGADGPDPGTGDAPWSGADGPDTGPAGSGSGPVGSARGAAGRWPGPVDRDAGRWRGSRPGPARPWSGADGPGAPPEAAGAAGPWVGGRRAATGRRRWVRGAVALAAAAAVGVFGTLAAVRPWQDRSTTAPPVASPAATLAPVPGGPGGVSGQALVVRGEAGPELRLSTSGLPALNQGYYEVWVFDGGQNMVAVGVLGPGSTATLPLPPTLDLRTFAIVDISQEKYDGDQTHSETSVLRGTLTG